MRTEAAQQETAIHSSPQTAPGSSKSLRGENLVTGNLLGIWDPHTCHQGSEFTKLGGERSRPLEPPRASATQLTVHPSFAGDTKLRPSHRGPLFLTFSEGTSLQELKFLVPKLIIHLLFILHTLRFWWQLLIFVLLCFLLTCRPYQSRHWDRVPRLPTNNEDGCLPACPCGTCSPSGEEVSQQRVNT